MRVLVACEYSGRVREAFRKRGHDAWSCDLLPAEDGSEFHFQTDVHNIPNGYGDVWDLLIAHPPCTRLCSSGARWWLGKRDEQVAAADFFMSLADYPAEKIALENPVGIMSSLYRKPDQIIHPWMFGHGETKATCLWLKNLPKLIPTNVVAGRSDRVHKMPPGPNRWKERSRTYLGIADAMAEQWGAL